MSREKIEIEVITYEQERLNYFTDLMKKAQKRYHRLFKKHKDAPYLSEESVLLSDAGREAQFHGDVVEMLEKGYRKQKYAKWVDNHCTACGMTPIGEEIWTKLDLTPPKFEWFMDYCPCCGAKMKDGAE